MALVLEDGSIVDDANSYATEDMLDDYADNNGVTLASGDVEAALIRASLFIDVHYSGSFPGYRKAGRDQNMQWPRAAAYDNEGWLIADDEIPSEVITATMEAAIRELISPNSMLPDLERGGAIASIRAGSVGITYAHNASNRTEFTLIDGIMSNILSGIGSGNGLFGSVVRG